MTRLAPDLGRVKADPGQVQQVLVNLAVNARDAMPGAASSRSRPRTSSSTRASRAATRGGRARPYVHAAGERHRIGHGRVDPRPHLRALLHHQRAGQGHRPRTGHVYGIITQSGGAIRVDSEVGRGAAFRIYLPRVEAAAALHAPPGRSPRRAHRAARRSCWWKTSPRYGISRAACSRLAAIPCWRRPSPTRRSSTPSSTLAQSTCC